MRRIPIKQIYKSPVELQSFAAYRLLKMMAVIAVVTVAAFALRIVFNDQEPFSLDIVSMLRERFDRTFQLGDETTSPVDFITAMWGVVVTICLGVAFQSERFVSDRDAIGSFSSLLICSALATSFITGFWIPEMYHTNGIAKTVIITGAGALLMGWILNYGSQIYITHRSMRRNERARDVDLRQYARLGNTRTGYWQLLWRAVAVCVADMAFWWVLSLATGQIAHLRSRRGMALVLASSLFSTGIVVLHAYVRNRFVESIPNRGWSRMASFALGLFSLVVMWYVLAVLWTTMAQGADGRRYVLAVLGAWCLANLLFGRAVFGLRVLHPLHGLLQDARFTQKAMQWQHYELFAQFVESNALPRHDVSEYGMDLRLLVIPWKELETALADGVTELELVPECASLFFPDARKNGIPLVAFSSEELKALIRSRRKSRGWKATPDLNRRAFRELVRYPVHLDETINETLCLYLALICDDVSYVTLLRDA